MDIASVVGLVLGATLLVISILIAPGSPFGAFIDYPSMMVVLGGSISAVLICFPLKAFLNLGRVVKNVFLNKQEDVTELIGQIDTTEQIIRQSAQPVEVNATCPLETQEPDDVSFLDELESLTNGNACACGGVTGNPNNVYGWGEIDALEAVKLALESE